MIPKIIHYCWLSNDKIPQNLQQCMVSWKEKLPDYKFIKWDFSRFDKECSPWVKEAFEHKKYAFACDFIRLYAVYNYGGIYMDMDIEVRKPFDNLLSQEYMIAYEQDNTRRIEAGCFGAEAKNLYLKECLKHYNGRHFVHSDGSFDQTVLPVIMQETMERINLELEIYTSDYFTCKSFDTGVITTTENTYAIHHFAGSWKTPEEQAIIEETQRLSRYTGYFIARNIIEYKYAIKNRTILSLTEKKILGKLKQI